MADFRRGRLMNTFVGFTNKAPSDEWSKVLTRSEFKVALLVARGLSNKKIAHELGLSVGTVKVHLNRVFRKLGAKRRYDLIVQASAIAHQRRVQKL